MRFVRPAALAATCMAWVLGGCAPQSHDSSESVAGHEAAGAQFERGPHRGRLLRDGAFALELQIFEDGVPPEFHVYLFRDTQPLTPGDAQVTVELKRLDGEVNRFEFAPDGDFLRGNGTVHEPHSFVVTVNATEGGRSHRWAFDSFEGRTSIAAATAAAAGIKTEVAAGATLTDALVLTGRLVPDAERVRAVSARFPGLIREVFRSAGDAVKAGEPLARIESNESLQTYVLNAPISGVITERRANAGETAGAAPLFVITDYGALWAELVLFPRDLARVKTGQPVALKAVDGDLSGAGRIVRIAPADGGQHGAEGLYTARVALDNKDRRWAPGLFVEGQVQVGQIPVALAVRRSGLQAFRDFTVVFEQVGDTYEVRMLELGRADGTWIEVSGGLKPGARYVTDNSYLIKADIEKSGASHDH